MIYFNFTPGKSSASDSLDCSHHHQLDLWVGQLDPEHSEPGPLYTAWERLLEVIILLVI